MSSNSDRYPLVDFSDMPGCQSPEMTPCGRSVFTDSTVSSTKSRISSIFSMTSSNFNDSDDPFNLKVSARKARPTIPKESIVNTGLLIDVGDSLSSELKLPNSISEVDEECELVGKSGTHCEPFSQKSKVPKDTALTDWEKLRTEAQALAGDLKKDPDLDEMLLNSPLLNGSSLLSASSDIKLVDSSPELSSPIKALKFLDEEEDVPIETLQLKPELKENAGVASYPNKTKVALDEVYLDDQLERAIKKSSPHKSQNVPKRKPLSSVNNVAPKTKATPKKTVVPKPTLSMTDSKVRRSGIGTPMKPPSRLTTPMRPPTANPRRPIATQQQQYTPLFKGK